MFGTGVIVFTLVVVRAHHENHCQRVPPAGSQVVDSDLVELDWVTSVGAETPKEFADAQVPLVRSSISGRGQENKVEYLNEDTDSRDTCMTDLWPIDSHCHRSVHNVSISANEDRSRDKLRSH